MDAFIQLPADRRRNAFVETEARLGLNRTSVEKDLWVCWTLREIFQLPDIGAHLFFKGGTSLSKTWRLIDRFSEDIDIVIDRAYLGFAGDASPERAPSKKQQRQRLEDLRKACQQAIRDRLQPAFISHMGATLSKDQACNLTNDPDDPDGQTLLLQYSSVFPPSDYVRPAVKIEMGARSDTEPSETPPIRPYVAEALPEIRGMDAFPVRVVAARRTFWEKAMLLHEETFRPAGKPRKARLARHYYDLWCLITKGIADQAVADDGLFDRVLAHRKVFFRWSWMDYTKMRRGSLRLVPPEDQLKDWAADYTAMGTEMFFGEVPPFETVLKVVGDFERRFNQ
ncbi:MAG: nucleotidyl transferase AbiEii/AbiGii toxin family protein [Verrucomicrobia bacterium]|nr:nucleotidyl transferase AbiEii/AbiGii toxin family protein [Verrucomicrobiota bacterium]